jgi:hypothetical protein
MGLAVEYLDDDHTPTAARTSIPLLLFSTTVGANVLTARRGCGHAEEPTGQCNIGDPVAVGEEPVVADAVRPVGQDVDQEAADELVVGLQPTGLTRGVEGHQLVASVALGPVILPFEGHALAVEGDEPAVGDSDPVRVAGKIGEHSLGSAIRPLNIDHPFALAQCGQLSFEGGRLGQGLVGIELQARPAW